MAEECPKIEWSYEENSKDFLTDSRWSTPQTNLDRGTIRGLLGRLKHPIEAGNRRGLPPDNRLEIIRNRLIPVLECHRGDPVIEDLWGAYAEELGNAACEATIDALGCPDQDWERFCDTVSNS